MSYYVYKITNLHNGKYYIGKRKHNDPYNDKYMGSGKLIKLAIEKYGISSFTKEILEIFDTNDEAAKLEADLVTIEAIKLGNMYNLHEGGHGGFFHTSQLPVEERPNIIKIRKMIKDGEWRCGGTNNWNDDTREKCVAQLIKNQPDACKAAQTETARKKRKDTFKQIGHQQKEKNSGYGTAWCVMIDSEDLNCRRKFKKDNIPTGWITTTEWRQNRVKKNSSGYGKSWYNDGNKNYFLKRDDPKINDMGLQKKRIL